MLTIHSSTHSEYTEIKYTQIIPNTLQVHCIHVPGTHFEYIEFQLGPNTLNSLWAHSTHS